MNDSEENEQANLFTEQINWTIYNLKCFHQESIETKQKQVQ